MPPSFTMPLLLDVDIVELVLRQTLLPRVFTSLFVVTRWLDAFTDATP